MINFKPCIFIGSSKEGKAIAQLVEKKLSHIAECKIWYKQFGLGTSAFEELVNNLSLYDYGILIATSDDVAISRRKKSSSPRDNIIFEFGLFTGRLGRQRSFLMAESGIKIPSDLSGITLPFFPTTHKKGRLMATSASEQRKRISSSARQRLWYILSPGFSFRMQEDSYIHGCSCAAEVGTNKKTSRSSKIEADYWLEGYRGQHKAYITEDARYFPLLNRSLSLLWIHDAI